MDRVQATARYGELWRSAQLLDHQAGAGGQHIREAVAVGRVAVTVRCSGQHNLISGTNRTTSGKGTCLGLHNTDGTTRYIQRSAYGPTTLDE